MVWTHQHREHRERKKDPEVSKKLFAVCTLEQHICKVNANLLEERDDETKLLKCLIQREWESEGDVRTINMAYLRAQRLGKFRSEIITHPQKSQTELPLQQRVASSCLPRTPHQLTARTWRGRRGERPRRCWQRSCWLLSLCLLWAACMGNELQYHLNICLSACPWWSQ